jgi:hypothetical protein
VYNRLQISEKLIILNVIPIFLLCSPKNKVAFKIIIELVIDQMVILEAIFFLERHKKDIGIVKEYALRRFGLKNIL